MTDTYSKQQGGPSEKFASKVAVSFLMFQTRRNASDKRFLETKKMTQRAHNLLTHPCQQQHHETTTCQHWLTNETR